MKIDEEQISFSDENSNSLIINNCEQKLDF